jgi:phage terminase large subunit-like protein
MKTEVEKIVNNYCNDILKNKIPSCSYVKKVIKRFNHDLRKEQEQGWDFFMNWEKVQQFYDFSKLIKLPDKDEFIHLLPWQLFIFTNLLGFCYKNNPDKRRFRQGSVYVPRKNGKTTGLLFPLILWDFITTESAESYFFEKDLAQGYKVFNELKHIISQNKLLRENTNSTIDTIRMNNSRSSFFTSESIGIDGYRPSIAVIDEYWCFPDNRAITSMRMGGRARLNSLTLIITTAGLDLALPAYEEYQKVEKVLNGLILDDTYFGILFGIDQNDDPMTPEAYIKANPSIDVIIDRKILEQDLQDAIATPSHKPDYIAKTLNVWNMGTTTWIPFEKLEYLKNTTINWDDFKDDVFYASFDLSSINDFTAYTLCCKKNDNYYFKHRFYIPLETVGERYKKENISILEWIEKGFIETCPGPTIDYGYIFSDFQKDMENFNIKEITYDNWHSQELFSMIENEYGNNLVTASYYQNLKFLSGPTKAYEKAILEKKIIDPNPVIEWMIGNTVIKVNENGDYRPLKDFKSSHKRIDGVITSIMALDRCQAHNKNNPETALSFSEFMGLF